MWSRSHFDHTAKSYHNIYNWTGSFNKWILATRNKPIMHKVTKWLNVLMKLMFNRGNVSRGWDPNALVLVITIINITRSNDAIKYIRKGCDDHKY